MKVDPKFYRVSVDAEPGGAGLVCVTYNLDGGRKFVGVEYYELVFSLEQPELNIPSSRQATFQEELRVLHQAASTYEGARDKERSHIEGRLKEAYGEEATVHIEEIEPQK